MSFNIRDQDYQKAMLNIKGYKYTKYGPYGYCHFFARGGRRITIDFISGPLGPLSLDIWGQDFPKVMLGAKGKSVPTMGPVAIVILLLEAT